MAHPALAIGETLTRLEDTPRHIAALTAHLTAAHLLDAPEPDAWSANDVLAHLRCCADVWGGYIRTIIDEPEPTIRAVSPRGWIRRTDYPTLAFRASWQAFSVQRVELVALLRSLSPADWSRSAVVKRAGKVETLTVLSYAERIADHEHHHLDQFSRIATMVAPRG